MSNQEGFEIQFTAIIDSYKSKKDLNYFFNASNILNQDLVFETYDYFNEGDGQNFFEPLDFLNLLDWHYQYIIHNVEMPFDILNHLESLPISPKQKHILIAFILKWFGGYPVNNLNAQYNTVLKLVEKKYRSFMQVNKDLQQNLTHEGLTGKGIDQDDLDFYKLETDFLNRLDKLIENSVVRKEFRRLEKQFNTPINILQDNNEDDKAFVDIMIFISHSSKDEELVKLFTDRILQLALKIDLSNIFCTSIQACSITTGEDFRSVIKQRLIESTHVIQIITENYKGSEVCLNEMGAAWVLSNKVIPLIVNPIKYDSVGFIHQPNQLLKLDALEDILKFIEEINPQNKQLNLTEVNRQVSEFIRIVQQKFSLDNRDVETVVDAKPKKSQLSDAAIELLLEGAKDKSNRIWKHPVRLNPLKVNQKEFGNLKDKRSLAKYYSGLDELIEGEYVKEMSTECVELTDKGYNEADAVTFSSNTNSS